jgi:hypothetical protein
MPNFVIKFTVNPQDYNYKMKERLAWILYLHVINIPGAMNETWSTIRKRREIMVMDDKPPNW